MEVLLKYLHRAGAPYRRPRLPPRNALGSLSLLAGMQGVVFCPRRAAGGHGGIIVRARRPAHKVCDVHFWILFVDIISVDHTSITFLLTDGKHLFSIK
jgi:hypothetical protein